MYIKSAVYAISLSIIAWTDGKLAGEKFKSICLQLLIRPEQVNRLILQLFS